MRYFNIFIILRIKSGNIHWLNSIFYEIKFMGSLTIILCQYIRIMECINTGNPSLFVEFLTYNSGIKAWIQAENINKPLISTKTFEGEIITFPLKID